ncbi:MAG TPA: Rieske 2Fe-2S domain-containing protein, partial [Roseateles sp.]
MFITDTWYVAARSDEVGTGKPLGRKVCNHAMALFRNSSGVVSAVEDFCPHRGAPLSLGSVV